MLLTYLMAEVGEISDKARALEGNRVKSEHIRKDDLAEEIVDSIYCLMLIANYYHLDLDKYWTKRLKGIREKFN